VTVTAFGVAVSRIALAAPHDDKSADPKNEALYADARAAWDAGDYDRACPLYAELYAREHVPAALFTLAECEARRGRPVPAIADFEAFLRQTQSETSPIQEQRRRVANEQIVRLSKSVGRVRIAFAKPERGTATVRVDGEVVFPANDDTVAVTPGDHAVAISTDDGRRAEARVSVSAGETRIVDLALAEPARPPAPEQERPRKAPFPIVPVAVGAAGAVVLVTGAVLGGIAWGAKDDIRAHCVDHHCDATGKDDADRAQGFATASTVAISVGVLTIGVAAVLYLVRPRAASTTARIAPAVSFP
jgi:hypothetical protein